MPVRPSAHDVRTALHNPHATVNSACASVNDDGAPFGGDRGSAYKARFLVYRCHRSITTAKEGKVTIAR